MTLNELSPGVGLVGQTSLDESRVIVVARVPLDHGANKGA
jgi:hypothetical protein